MATSTILAVVFGASALLTTAVTPYAIYRDRKLAREGLRTTGRVVAIEDDNDGGYQARIEFVTQSGARHSFFASTQRDGRRIGEIVRVRYLVDSLQQAAASRPSPRCCSRMTRSSDALLAVRPRSSPTRRE